MLSPGVAFVRLSNAQWLLLGGSVIECLIIIKYFLYTKNEVLFWFYFIYSSQTICNKYDYNHLTLPTPLFC